MSSTTRRIQPRVLMQALVAFAWMSTLLTVSVAISGCVSTRPTPPGISPVETSTPLTPTAHVSSVSAQAVVRIGMTVSDLDRATDFYTNVLGFVKVAEHESTGDYLEHLTGVFGARTRTATLRLGEEEIELTQYLAPEGRPIPIDSRSNDRWFQHIAIVVSDMDEAYAHLRAHNVRHASTGPQTLPHYLPNAAGISAFYFKDPDGHVLEVIHFPSGKGDPRWTAARKPETVFLGIDHTAIAVANTQASLSFYRDTLGLRIAGGSENYGPEQERLNNVFGVRLRITTLKAASGPGIELLEYLAPATGRPYPTDSRANDLWHWQTTLFVNSLTPVVEQLDQSRTTWISPGLVMSANHPPALMVRDPDGHAMLITQRARQ